MMMHLLFTLQYTRNDMVAAHSLIQHELSIGIRHIAMDSLTRYDIVSTL